MLTNIWRRKLLLFITLLFLGFLCYHIKIYNPVLIQVHNIFYPESSIHCYKIKTKSLQDISEIKVRRGKSIFFHETSCASHSKGKIVIASRQACAVESAAKSNPNSDIYLLYSSPGTLKLEENTESDKFLKALLSYDNIKLLHIDYENYTRNTPIEDLYQSGKLELSSYPWIHASDLVRFITLWKYGGIYLDLDVVVLKNIDGLNPNFAGLESDTAVAIGIMNFSPNGIGHYHVKSVLNDIKESFQGDQWGYNGPGAITRLAKRICAVEKPLEMIKRDCQGFTVYPPNAFYAVPWWNWRMFFDESLLPQILALTKNSYIIHVWNKHSSTTPVLVNSSVPYAVYARKHCPKVFEACEKVF